MPPTRLGPCGPMHTAPHWLRVAPAQPPPRTLLHMLLPDDVDGSHDVLRAEALAQSPGWGFSTCMSVRPPLHAQQSPTSAADASDTRAHGDC
jgi:hypothetical protein